MLWQMEERPLTINVFSMDPALPATPFAFRTHNNVVSSSLYSWSSHGHSGLQADDEYEILGQVHDLVESNYFEGKPLHHLPSAQNIALKPGASVFFIVEYTDFITFSTQTIHWQDIAPHRHIVIRNVPQPAFEWLLETLSEIGALDQPREIQGKSVPSASLYFALTCTHTVGECRDNDEIDRMLKVGTLRDIFNCSSERVLSCLQLPTSSMEVVNTPGLRHVIICNFSLTCSSTTSRQLASDRWAWLHTRGSSGLRPIPHPIDVTNWATVATAGATSWIHQDTDGLATSTQLLAGCKYWVAFTRDPFLARSSVRGDMGSIGFSPPYREFQDHKLDRWMCAEGVLLHSTDML
jgi:hypothetical protein